MKKVEIVIKLSEDDYKYLKEFERAIRHTEKGIGTHMIFGAILDGTVLPKGHGKLIDANVLWDAFQDLGQDFYEAFDFAEANAVIEADEAESEG